MNPDEKELQLRNRSASASGLKKSSIGKTPLERMHQVAELSRRMRMMKRLAHGRDSASRTR